jgi:hypothetical protein
MFTAKTNLNFYFRLVEGHVVARGFREPDRFPALEEKAPSDFYLANG